MLEVGQKVYLKWLGRGSRARSEIIECRITKIGRKYFYVDHGYQGTKFRLDDLSEVSDYSIDWKLYLSKQDCLDEMEYEKLLSSIRTFFARFGKCSLTLEQLREIHKLIETDLK